MSTGWLYFTGRHGPDFMGKSSPKIPQPLLLHQDVVPSTLQRCLCSLGGILTERITEETHFLPCLFHKDFESIWASGGNWEVQAVAPNTPNDGRRVHIFVGDLPCQQLPEHHSKGPVAGRTQRQLRGMGSDLTSLSN